STFAQKLYRLSFADSRYADLFFGFLWGVLRRNGGVPWRCLRQVNVRTGVDIANRPADAATEQIEHEFTLPVFRAVAEGSEERTAFAIHAGPGHGIRRAIVAGTAHSLGVERENYVEIVTKIFQRIPLFGETHGRIHAGEAREARVTDDDACRLQTRIGA